MTTSITIRDVPDEVRDTLAARAARAGQSLQEYMKATVVGLASRPTVEELLSRVEARKVATGTTVDIEALLSDRDADRR